MKFIFAPDSFKGSLSAAAMTEILCRVAQRHFPGCQCVCMPMADGGEGTVEAVVTACGGRYEDAVVTGPDGRRVSARMGYLPSGTAVIEMAAASGLPLMENGPDPLRASSYGTGELIAHALRQGAGEILLGIGGSATNEGGMGMLRALGARFYDAQDKELSGTGESFLHVARVELSGLMPELKRAGITVICDVTNPLLGEHGATAVYGPQKGVTEKLQAPFEEAMARYAALLGLADAPGAGAAGGMGAVLATVLGARLRPGLHTLLELANFDAALQDCDLVITGEGRLDAQSVRFGKAPAGIAQRCAQRGVPTLCITGGMGSGAQAYYEIGLSSVMPTVNAVMTLKDAMTNARLLYEDAAERAFRLLRMGMQLKTGCS